MGSQPSLAHRSPYTYLDVPPSEHHGVHLLQGQLSSFRDLIFHKSKALAKEKRGCKAQALHSHTHTPPEVTLTLCFMVTESQDMSILLMGPKGAKACRMVSSPSS